MNWKKIVRGVCWSILACYFFSRFIIPNPEFESPSSTIVADSSGVLLGAKIATDGQWRFPQNDRVETRFAQAVLTFEDQYFYYHFGVNPVAIARAVKENVSAGRFAQGGSTLTMQVARLLARGQKRTLWQKLKELLMAFHLEVNYSKEEILSMYVSHAPFGGNVVGVETAAWRYFGRDVASLSWGELASLAVLPNAPSIIYPGKNEGAFRAKRDRLLDRLQLVGVIDAEECELAKLEPIPVKPLPLPGYARHVVAKMDRKYRGKRVRTGIDAEVQRQAQLTINRFIKQYQSNEVHNAAAIILDVKTNQIVAYVGNASGTRKHGNAVDVVEAKRSTGSLLKPFIYGLMLSEGRLLPQMLLTDIPTQISGYSPENYYKEFDGVVPADAALYRSLNVPFVRLLQEYGVNNFHNQLKALGMSSFTRPSDHYGLSLMLGGGEGRLIEMTNAYASMARTLLRKSGVSVAESSRPTLNIDAEGKPVDVKLTPGAIYKTFEALTQVNRPVSMEGWKSFESTKKIAWKTGTSFGNKDAWAIGVTPEYAIGVWVGNADGEGRSGLTGVSGAAPIMFQLFESMPATSWFGESFDDLDFLPVCRRSGYRPNPHCDVVDTILSPLAPNRTNTCPYHRTIIVSKDEKNRLNQSCANTNEMKKQAWFVLKPAQAWYYRRKSATYRTLPPFAPGCEVNDAKVMEWIYPKNDYKLFIPVELDGDKGRAVFKIAHERAQKQLFWYLDGDYIGFTQDFHELSFTATAGKHLMVVMDEDGGEIRKPFEIINN